MDLTFLIPISFAAAVVLAWYFYLKMRNKERMAIIEKGKDVPSFTNYKFPWLKIGIIMTGIGIGVFTTIFLQSHPVKKYIFVERGLILLMSILFFGGIAMIIAAIIDKIHDRK